MAHSLKLFLSWVEITVSSYFLPGNLMEKFALIWHSKRVIVACVWHIKNVADTINLREKTSYELQNEKKINKDSFMKKNLMSWKSL